MGWFFILFRDFNIYPAMIISSKRHEYGNDRYMKRCKYQWIHFLICTKKVWNYRYMKRHELKWIHFPTCIKKICTQFKKLFDEIVNKYLISTIQWSLISIKISKIFYIIYLKKYLSKGLKSIWLISFFEKKINQTNIINSSNDEKMYQTRLKPNFFKRWFKTRFDLKPKYIWNFQPIYILKSGL